MTRRKSKADGRAVVLNVDGIFRDALLVEEMVDGVGEVVEGVGVLFGRRGIAVAEAGIVGSNHVVLVAERRNEVAEHMGRTGIAVQKDKRGSVLRPGFAVENL